jgi:tetratricopeptide (TPR) repeat protein
MQRKPVGVARLSQPRNFCMTTQTAEELFNSGLERYQAGESADLLIPVFKEVCDRAKKNSPAWTCLAWLYLLTDKPSLAYQAAQKALKLNPEDAQTRVNLILSMLDAGQKGVRSHVELVQRMVMIPEIRTEIEQNIEDGLKRKPDWSAMLRLQNWIFGEED